MKLYQINHLGKSISPPNLYTAFGVDISSNQTISFVGAGGKTTSIYTLAKELSSIGKKVIITTTTHMFLPEKNGVFEENQDHLLWQLNHRGIAVVGKPCTKKNALGKMTGTSPAFYQWMRTVADYILVEADGSKRFPLKFPASHEPVLHNDTNIVVVVGGLSCLNRPLIDCCHRWELVGSQLKYEPTKLIQPKDMANIIIKGYFDNEKEQKNPCQSSTKIYLNQCDNENIYKQALEVINNFKKEEIKREHIIIGSLL